MPSETNATKTCATCGVVIPAAARFCPACRAQQPEDAPATRICPLCGEPHLAEARFCAKNGQPIHWDQVAAPTQPRPPAPPPPAPPPVDKPTPAAGQAACPRCGSPVKPSWAVCPRCNAVLQPSRRKAVWGWLLVPLILVALLGGLYLLRVPLLCSRLTPYAFYCPQPTVAPTAPPAETAAPQANALEPTTAPPALEPTASETPRPAPTATPAPTIEPLPAAQWDYTPDLCASFYRVQNGFSDGDLLFACKPVSGGWYDAEEVAVQGNVGRYNHLVFGADQTPFISYYDQTSGQLMLAWKDGREWVNRVIDSGEVTGLFTASVMGPDGWPVIAYYNETQGAVMLARYQDGVWQKTLVDPIGRIAPYEFRIGLAAAPDGAYYLAYRDYLQNRQFSVSRVIGDEVTLLPAVDKTPGTGGFAGIAVKPDGTVMVVYQDMTVGRTTRYAEFNGQIWKHETIDPAATDSGSYLSLALDPGGAPYVAYLDEVRDNPRLVRRTASGWQTYWPDTTPRQGSFTALAIAADGRIALAYTGTKEPFYLKLVLGAPGNWSRYTVGGTDEYAEFPSLAFP